MKHLLFTVALGLVVSCSNQNQADSYVFRNDERPQYSNTMSVEDLAGIDGNNITVIDVRLEEDLAKSPNLITGATYRNPEMISDWAGRIPKDKPVLVYCVKGKWVSQKAATYLSESGYEVYSLDGGINAWNAANLK